MATLQRNGEPLKIGSPPSLGAARALLESARLPESDLETLPLESFFFAGSADAPVGLIGLELLGAEALLRSLVVAPEYRRQGLGGMLLAHAEAHAASRRVRTIYLLTTTAEIFFSRRGYALVDRAQAPLSIQSTAEFSTLCPSDSVFMSKRI
jgi:amino-acid N-acetyltransferase